MPAASCDHLTCVLAGTQQCLYVSTETPRIRRGSRVNKVYFLTSILLTLTLLLKSSYSVYIIIITADYI